MVPVGKNFRKAAIFMAAVSLIPLPAYAAQEQEAKTSAPAQIAAQSAVKGPSDAAILANMRFAESILGLQDLPPVDESRLPAARALAGALVQQDALADVMQKMFGRTFRSITTGYSGISREDLRRSGMMTDEQIAKVTNADLDAVMTIMDPQRAERAEKMQALTAPLFDTLVKQIQPQLLEGTARALALRHDVAELEEIGAFLKTGAGSNFARSVLALSADPQMMAASLQAAPDILPQLRIFSAQLDEFTQSAPKPRSLESLSGSELDQIAKHLGVNAKEFRAKITADRDNWTEQRRD